MVKDTLVWMRSLLKSIHRKEVSITKIVVFHDLEMTQRDDKGMTRDAAGSPRKCQTIKPRAEVSPTVQKQCQQLFKIHSV